MSTKPRTWRDLRRPSPTPSARGVKMGRDRAKTIQLIHVGARNLGLIDPAYPASDPARDYLYRALIRDVTGRDCTSCADCTDPELRSILSEMHTRGFRIEPAETHGRRPRNMAEGDMRAKVEALLTSMSLPWAYAEAILCQQRRLPKVVACPINLTNAIDLRYLIAALDTEQRKRILLAQVNELLVTKGMTEEELESNIALRKGWSRRLNDLELAVRYLSDIDA